jgi:hypothetical protein
MYKHSIKYPRTLHLPWSPGKTKDDKVLKNTDQFIGKIVTVTEKMDGENTNLYNVYSHARSMDSRDHESRHWVKKFHSTFKYNIPELWRVCGENVYAKHSIYYNELLSYFYMFSIWNQDNYCLSWEETQEWAELLNIPLVPVLYQGIYNEDIIKKCFTGISKCGGEQEGYLVRVTEKFHYKDFGNNIAKFVRADHVQTGEHWLEQEIVPNKLKEDFIFNF